MFAEVTAESGEAKHFFSVCVLYFWCVLLRFTRLIHLPSVTSQQAMLMRQQGRLDGRVQNIDEQLTKLESDKTLMKVQYGSRGPCTCLFFVVVWVWCYNLVHALL